MQEEQEQPLVGMQVPREAMRRMSQIKKKMSNPDKVAHKKSRYQGAVKTYTDKIDIGNYTQMPEYNTIKSAERESRIAKDFAAWQQFMEFKKAYPSKSPRFTPSMLHYDKLTKAENEGRIAFEWRERDIDGDGNKDVIVYGPQGVKAINGYKLAPAQHIPYMEYADKYRTKDERKAKPMRQFAEESYNIPQALLNPETGYYTGAEERKAAIENSDYYTTYPGFRDYFSIKPTKMNLRTYIYNYTIKYLYDKFYKPLGAKIRPIEKIAELNRKMIIYFFATYIKNSEHIQAALDPNSNITEKKRKAAKADINYGYDNYIKIINDQDVYEDLVAHATELLKAEFPKSITRPAVDKMNEAVESGDLYKTPTTRAKERVTEE